MSCVSLPRPSRLPRAPTAALLLAALAVASSGCGPRVLRELEREPLYSTGFTGFYLADVTSGERLAAQHADQLFTPASNVKLLTLATALAWLPQDSLPALAYQYDADTLRLWGLAYPTLAFDDAPYNERIRRAIAAWPGTVEVNLHGYTELPRYGDGWMWDDFPYDFQTERSGLPVYRNGIRIWREGDALGVRPGFFVIRNNVGSHPGTLVRGEDGNRWRVNLPQRSRDTLTGPLYRAASMMTQLLEDWTGHPVRYHNQRLPPDWGLHVWHGEPRDTLLRAMMLPSDNFLAEQLLLQAGLVHDDITDVPSITRRAREGVLHLREDELGWVDGSGLSRYDLASPRALAGVCRALYLRDPTVIELFPAGGVSGSIRDWYAGPGGVPYVFAKTGTLRNNHCLTGFLRAESGRMLVFSFMHNNVPGPSRAYREAMGRTLEYIRTHY